MADSESEERLKRAATLRRTVAETIARVRRTTAHIGVPRPPSDPDAEPPAASAPPEPPPAAKPEAPSAKKPEPPRAESPGEAAGLGNDVSALLERTRSVIERTRRVIEESRATLIHPRRPDPAAEDEDDEKP
jgi:hypothetical protein